MPNIDQRWTDVDDYLASALLGDDPALADVVQANVAAELPPIDVTPMQGKLLHPLTSGAWKLALLATI